MQTKGWIDRLQSNNFYLVLYCFTVNVIGLLNLLFRSRTANVAVCLSPTVWLNVGGMP